MKTLGKIFGIIVLLVAVAIAGQIGKFGGTSAVENYDQGKKKSLLTGVLEDVVNEVNSKTPMMVDSAIRLDNAISIRDKLRYNYTLVDYIANEIAAEQIHSSLEETVKNKVCTSMKTLIRMGATIEYAYYGNKGREITVISIPPSKCGR